MFQASTMFIITKAKVGSMEPLEPPRSAAGNCQIVPCVPFLITLLHQYITIATIRWSLGHI